MVEPLIDKWVAGGCTSMVEPSVSPFFFGEGEWERVHLYGGAAPRDRGYWRVHLYGEATSRFFFLFWWRGIRFVLVGR